MTQPESGKSPADVGPVEKRIVRRAGGRHLVFRIQRPRNWLVPRPYALISNIEGPLWMFYGVGQVWITHRRIKRIRDWTLRVPRVVSHRIIELVGKLEQDIDRFISQIEDQDLIGTVLIDRRTIEFHWTVPRDQREDSTNASKRQAVVDLHFNQLATAFAKLQLVGEEGVEDVPADKIQFQKMPE